MEGSKLHEQATGKGQVHAAAKCMAELSYSYWAANAAGEAPPPQPKKLSEEEAAAQAQQLRHVDSGASAWNAAGTWEERPVAMAWVQGQLGELLGALRHSHGGAEVAVVEVTSCSGEAHQWFVRGKKRAGFELSVEFKWRAQLGGAAVTGTAKVPHAAADELDELQLEVSLDSSAAGGEGEGGAAAPTDAQRQAARAAVSAMRDAVEAAMERLLERMRQK